MLPSPSSDSSLSSFPRKLFAYDLQLPRQARAFRNLYEQGPESSAVNLPEELATSNHFNKDILSVSVAVAVSCFFHSLSLSRALSLSYARAHTVLWLHAVDEVRIPGATREELVVMATL